MKKLLIALFSVFVLVGCANNPYKIDLVATANAPWGVGERVIEEGSCFSDQYDNDTGCYTQFLGVAANGNIVIQDYYLSGKKYSDPYQVISINAAKLPLRDRVSSIDGVWVIWHENGQKMVEANFQNGQWHGVRTEWYENGQKWWELNYQNGQWHGVQTEWYENGQKREEWNYQNGQWHGVTTKWHENGQKRVEENYQSDQLHGVSIGWYENGQKWWEGNYQNGKRLGIWRRWDEEGNLIEERDYDPSPN